MWVFGILGIWHIVLTLRGQGLKKSKTEKVTLLIALFLFRFNRSKFAKKLRILLLNAEASGKK